MSVVCGRSGMNNMRKLILWFVVLLSCPCLCRAQGQYKFRLIDVTSGLSDNQIRDLSEVPDGRVGVRTASILNIYDGASFVYFPYDTDKKYVWQYARPPKEYYDKQGRVWMKELNYLLLLDLETNTFNYDIPGELASMGVEQRVKNLFVDESKNFWFVWEDNTLSFYDVQAATGRVINRGGDDFTRKYGVPLELAQYKNTCWIVYSSGLIRCYDYTSSEFLFQDARFVGLIGEQTDRLYLHPDSVGNLWLMYNDGVFFYNRTLREWREVADISGISNFFTCMDLDCSGDVWAGTSRSGLRHIDHKTFRVEELPVLPLVDGGEINNDIYTLLADGQGGLWVGTLFQGLCYYHPTMQKFGLAQTGRGGSYLTNETVRCFLEEPDGTVLVGAREGLFRFNPQTREVTHLYADRITDLVLSLYRDHAGNVWVGTFLEGFYRIAPDGGCHHFRRSPNTEEADVTLNTSRAMYEDSRGNYYASVAGGVGVLDPETGKIRSMMFERHPQLKAFSLIHTLVPLGKDKFAAVGDNGIYVYDTAAGKLWLPDRERDRWYKPGVKYFSLLKDSRGLDWYATESGIRVWNARTGELYELAMADGLPNDAISSLLEDDDGAVWASSLNGISKITPYARVEGEPGYEFSVVNFDVSDGLQRGMYYVGAALKAKDGTLYFGGAHGFNYLNPRRMVKGKAIARPLLTGLSIFNMPVTPGAEYGGRVILEKTLDHTSELELRYDENFITLEFSGLNFANPSHTYYKYKLLNYDEDYVESNATRAGRAVYTGLQPGTYRFVVYAANSDKVWSDTPAELSIVVMPPFWMSYYAMAFYVLAAGGAVWFAFRRYRKRTERRLQEERRETALQQQENLDQMKLRFFTNISHEFRTPLTLILTPLGTLIRQQQDSELKHKLQLIYRNAERLLRLVNQLLDFRKLEMQGERLSLNRGDMVSFVREACETFREWVAEKSIGLEFEDRTERLYMNFDQDKMYKIVSNLLSNAVKFTPSGGSINVSVDTVARDGRDYAAIKVADTGCGIAEEDLERIFTRFYQEENGTRVQSGSGIGLHLVKGYVDLHGGEIKVDSKVGEGSTFTVFIPEDLQVAEGQAVQEETVPADMEDAVEEERSPLSQADGGLPTRKKILLVEDNEEFRDYLAGELKADFDVLEAADGIQGEELVHSAFPDLIISDLMMPRRDGLEFCRRMKGDLQTSHIPFILLTAKISDNSRIESYKVGADSYIAKPFNFEMLRVRIDMLIEQRERRNETLHKTIEITPGSITTTSLDEEFVKKALVCVERNIDNPDYSLEELSNDLGLSKTHLNRKLTAILNLTPLSFIRLIRLKRAAQLLSETQYNVNEIADMVGFNTLKYFNRYFKEEYKMTPTQYREDCRKRRLRGEL